MPITFLHSFWTNLTISWEISSMKIKQTKEEKMREVREEMEERIR